jgi:uncharacterized protein with HEPN domain
MNHKLAKCLLDALEACRAIIEFTDGYTFDNYNGSKLLRSAVERQFEILGESFNRIEGMDDAFRERLPEIGAIIGMRNRIIHGYDTVDNSIVWDAVQLYIPRLVKWFDENEELCF